MTMFKTTRTLLIATLAVAACFPIVAGARADEPKKAKNVILFIGDGDGFNSEIMGSYYHTGKPWGESYQNFPIVLGSATFSLHKHSNGVTEWDPVKEPEKNMGYNPEEFWKNPGNANWRPTNTELTDSSASATAINTGHKTLNGRVNIDPDGNPLENFAQKNIKAGRSVGVITDNQISHATPAGASAHSMARGNYEEIAKEQINEVPLTVLMGGGHPEYSNGVKRDKSPDELNYQYVGGRELWEKIKADDGYKGRKFIDQRSQFAEYAAATPGSGKELPKKLLGVARTTGDLPPIDGDVDNPQMIVEKYSQETVDAIPTLTEMTLASLNILSQNENGFYLMVEEGNIDHQNHSNNAANSVMEHVCLAKAVDAAIAWVEKYSSWDETLMIVTADHETGQIWGDGTYVDEDNNGKYSSKKDTFESFQKVPATPKGEVPAVQYLSGGHTNALVPFCAKGAGSELAKEFIRGKDEKAGKFWNFSGEFIYNSDVFNVMSAASGVK